MFSIQSRFHLFVKYCPKIIDDRPLIIGIRFHFHLVCVTGGRVSHRIAHWREANTIYSHCFCIHHFFKSAEYKVERKK